MRSAVLRCFEDRGATPLQSVFIRLIVELASFPLRFFDFVLRITVLSVIPLITSAPTALKLTTLIFFQFLIVALLSLFFELV